MSDLSVNDNHRTLKSISIAQINSAYYTGEYDDDVDSVVGSSCQNEDLIEDFFSGRKSNQDGYANLSHPSAIPGNFMLGRLGNGAIIRNRNCATEDELEAVLNRTQLKDTDPNFDELFDLTLSTEFEEKASAEAKKVALSKKIFRFGSSDNSVGSVRSRRCLHSTKSSQFLSNKDVTTPSRAARRVNSLSSTPKRAIGCIVIGSLKKVNSIRRSVVRRDIPSSSACELNNSHTATTLNQKMRGILRATSYNTNETYPEQLSNEEAYSESSVYVDGCSSESSVELENVMVESPPVFIVEAAGISSFQTSSLHLSISNVSIAEENVYSRSTEA